MSLIEKIHLISVKNDGLEGRLPHKNHLPLSQDGVVLGADTRATEGMVVADKNCSKIHYISPNI